MKPDIIFHIASEQQWKIHSKNGYYTLESVEQEGFIHCSTGNQINETANHLFEKNHNLLLLVIDAKRVKATIKYEASGRNKEKFPHIYGPLNLDAILDKISLAPNENGELNIEFTSN